MSENCHVVRKKTNALNRDVKALSILLSMGKYIYMKKCKNCFGITFISSIKIVTHAYL